MRKGGLTSNATSSLAAQNLSAVLVNLQLCDDTVGRGDADRHGSA
jgi:hypothetical protein